MAKNNAPGIKSNFIDDPNISANKKYTASEFNARTDWLNSPVQQITGSLDDTDIIIDGTKNYNITIVETGATRTITANAAGHLQGNSIKQRYQFDIDCTITLTNFDNTGNNTGDITPITAGTYDFIFSSNRNGINLEIPQNAGNGGGHEIQDNGTPLAQQPALNFIGATVTDNPGNSSTDVFIPTGNTNEKEVQFNSNLDNIKVTTWTGAVAFNTLSPITGGLSSASYETSTDGGDTWTDRADLAAVNTFASGFGSSTTGTQWRLRTTGNYVVSEIGLESITLIYTR